MYFKSSKNKVYFIAEIGSNHEGNFKEAKKILKDCIKSKADCAKIQIYTAKNIVSKKFSKERFHHFSKLKLNVDEYLELAHLTKKSGKDFSASIWDVELISIFSKYLKFYKIGSGDLTNYEIIEKIIKTGKPIIMSTGLSSLKDIGNTIHFIEKNNKKYKNRNMISLLHCNTAYPTPIENSNLGSIIALKKKFKRPIGYSDHTIGDFVTLLSYLNGAKIIEKHFSINPEKKTFRDHQISFNKEQTDRFLNNINSIKRVNTKKKDLVTISERKQNNFNIFRRSIYVVKNIKKNDILDKNNIRCLRPFKGICATNYFKIIGKKAKKNLKPGTALFKRNVR